MHFVIWRYDEFSRLIIHDQIQWRCCKKHSIYINPFLVLRSIIISKHKRWCALIFSAYLQDFIMKETIFFDLMVIQELSKKYIHYASNPSSSFENTSLNILLHMAAYGLSSTSTDFANSEPKSAAILKSDIASCSRPFLL